MDPTIVFVVGHENWGKSHTLRFLTNGDWRARTVNIEGVKFFIRRMSNDDKPRSYVDFMGALSPKKRKFLIAALCPNFERENAQTDSVLTSLKTKGYRLFFWVIKNQYGTDSEVLGDELSKLRSYGSVEVLQGHVEADSRAAALRQYVEFQVIANE